MAGNSDHVTEEQLARTVGEAAAVRAGFDELPIPVVLLEGSEYRFVGANAAYRAFSGREELIGLTMREAFPEIETQRLFELIERVYTSGEPVNADEWRIQFDPGDGTEQVFYLDFAVLPRRHADGTVYGVLIQQMDVTDRVRQRLAAQQDAQDAQRRYAAARDVVAELQRALLPTALPVLPRARVGARYLVAAVDQAAGGDWFDAITSPDGRVALVVGDVVGHGVAASAAMAQLRTVLADRLRTEADLAAVLAHVDAFAARERALRAATLAVVVLDPATGELSYGLCGHPAPMVIGTSGPPRLLAGSGTGPLGTGSTPTVATDTLAPGEVILLYSDGLIERPGRTLDDGIAELAHVAADAAADRVLPAGTAATVAERVCQLTVELLTRAGYSDDVTALAAQRLATPAAPFDLRVANDLASVRHIRETFGEWLAGLDVTDDDRGQLELAVSEVATNAIEHAYRPGAPGSVRVEAHLLPTGVLECRVTDDGRWQTPDTSRTTRGRGLLICERLLDQVEVTHPPQAADRPVGSGGTIVTLRHRIARPAMLASDANAQPTEPPRRPAFGVTVDHHATTPTVRVAGALDATTADDLQRDLTAACRSGVLPLTVDLTLATQLASAGVGALHDVRDQLATHRQPLTLLAAPGSPVAGVLDLVGLEYTDVAEAAIEGGA